ncbi:MAG: hypothetical protein RJB42_1370 [Bacteroidota bacterium]|jgi:hypothetical protein
MKQELIKSSADAISIGETFYKSGMFQDIKSAQQAVVKIMAGAEMGISPFQAMSGIHIIQGKPTIGAGLMASRVKASGKYNYKVTEMTDKVCTIDFIEGGQSIGTSSFTIEDAKKAGTKNLDKFPRNMLFARAMSNGVRWFCPDIYEGPVYVPEEMESITEDVQAVEVKKQLNEDQWNRLVKSIEEGKIELIEWAMNNVEMTEEQLAQISKPNDLIL